MTRSEKRSVRIQIERTVWRWLHQRKLQAVGPREVEELVDRLLEAVDYALIGTGDLRQ